MGRIVTTSKTDATDAGGFTPLEPGEYTAQIIGVEDAKTKKGDPVIRVQFKVTEGDAEGRRFRDFNVPVVPKWASGSTAFTFYQFFGALGVEFEDGETELPDNEDLIGQEVVVRLDTEEYNGALQQRVKGYKAVGAAPAPAKTKSKTKKKADEFVL